MKYNSFFFIPCLYTLGFLNNSMGKLCSSNKLVPLLRGLVNLA